MVDLELVRRIADAAEEADGAAPLDEATWLALRHRPQSVRSWVREDACALLIGGDLSIVVHPSARGRGLGTALAAEAVPPSGPVEAWSHGDHPAARVLAERHGLTRSRELWVMRRPSSAALPEPPVREGVAVRGYEPEDAEAIVRVNAAAFAAHPEQGAMGLDNLQERMSEDWFDPAGLLVAVDSSSDEVLGFHWTKQHSPALGEVYVVGISPAAQGRGLGKLLTLAGLQHLTGKGVDEVLLYVESDNAPAVAVYSGLGFEHAERDTHVQYRRA